MKCIARVVLFLFCIVATFGIGFLLGTKVAIETITGHEVEGIELHMLPHDPGTF